MVLAENLLVDMYWHGHCEKGSGQSEFLYLTMEGEDMPEFSSGKNALFGWLDTYVAKQVCRGRGDNVVRH